MREFRLIDQIRKQFPDGPGVLLGIGDDAAVLQLPPEQVLVVSTDTLVCGTHFLPDADPYALGHKSLAVNLSDLAAMGALPRWCLLNLTLPSVDMPFLTSFLEGLHALAKAFQVSLVGGDTTCGPFAVSITVLGSTPAQRGVLKRSGAQAGDGIYLSGTVGDAAAALARRLAATPKHAYFDARLDQPSPRVALGQALLGLAHSCIDVSDGLLADLGHICAQSGVGADLHSELLPLSHELRALVAPRAARGYALTGGDDYELCFTAPEANHSQIQALSAQLNLPITRIGTILPGHSIVLRNAQGKRIKQPQRAGYEHFST